MKYYLILLFVLGIFFNPFFGQKDSVFKPKKKYRLQPFVQVKSGIENVKFNHKEGPITFDNRTHVIQTYTFGLNYKLNDKFSLALRLANSYNPEFTHNNIHENNTLPMPWYGGRRWNDRSYGLEWSAAYQHHLKNNYTLKTALGFGRNNFTTGVFLDYSNYNDALGGADYTLVRKESSFTSNKIFLEIGLSKYFAHSRNLNVSLFYEYFLNPKFIGGYEIKENSVLSSGEITKSGNNVGLSLTYMLGRQERFLKQKAKKAKIIKMANDSANLNYYEAKKLIEKGDRKVWNEKSILLHASSGFFFTRNKFTGYENHFNSHFAMSLSTSVSAEIGLKKNLFLETGYSLDKYTVSEKLTEESILTNHYFSASKLNLGVGYRVFSKRNNKHLVNFQAGASLSFLNSPNSPSVSGYNYGGYSEPEFYYLGYHEYTVFPAIYLGIGRDFELNKNLFFSMNFKFNQGFVEIYKKEFAIQLYDSDTRTDYSKTYLYTINGTSMNLSFGFKYKFLGKKYKE